MEGKEVIAQGPVKTEDQLGLAVETVLEVFGKAPFSRREKERIGAELAEDTSCREVRSRPGPGGKRLTYLEGWRVVDIANRVFGFDGWTSQLISLQLRSCKQDSQNRWQVCAMATVRVTLRNGSFHEDRGGGTAENKKTEGEAILLAEKEAITDARKRALKNFGRRLGLSLYSDEHLRFLQSGGKARAQAAGAAAQPGRPGIPNGVRPTSRPGMAPAPSRGMHAQHVAPPPQRVGAKQEPGHRPVQGLPQTSVNPAMAQQLQPSRQNGPSGAHINSGRLSVPGQIGAAHVTRAPSAGAGGQTASVGQASHSAMPQNGVLVAPGVLDGVPESPERPTSVSRVKVEGEGETMTREALKEARLKKAQMLRQMAKQRAMQQQTRAPLKQISGNEQLQPVADLRPQDDRRQGSFDSAGRPNSALRVGMSPVTPAPHAYSGLPNGRSDGPVGFSGYQAEAGNRSSMPGDKRPRGVVDNGHPSTGYETAVHAQKVARSNGIPSVHGDLPLGQSSTTTATPQQGELDELCALYAADVDGS